jgi:hypothetical protein
VSPPLDALVKSLGSDRKRLPAIWTANRKRNADEPLRLKLTFMAARIDATRRLVASRDAGRPKKEPAAYPNVAAFEDDLQLVRKSLIRAGAEQACRTTVDPLLAAVRAHGFHGFMMDVRDHSDVHAAAIKELLAGTKGDADTRRLRAALMGKNRGAARNRKLSDDTRRVVDTFRAIRTIQDEAGKPPLAPPHRFDDAVGGRPVKGARAGAPGRIGRSRRQETDVAAGCRSAVRDPEDLENAPGHHAPAARRSNLLATVEARVESRK